MSGQLASMLAALVAGLVLQRARWIERLRPVIWTGYFWTLAPVLVVTTFLTIRLAGSLLPALAAAVLASWLTGAVAYAYARAVGRTREERGALFLGGAWGNTGFVGIPLTQLVFGHPGLGLAVVYDQLCWAVPQVSVSTPMARLHGRDAGRRPQRPLRALLVNPPIWATVGALLYRAGSGAVPALASLQHWAGDAVGPAGFLLLGLTLPFEPVAHGRDELGRAAGTLAIRFAGGPLALLLVGRVLGVHVPGAFYLLAGMPCAFHLVVLARLYDVRPALMRLLVVGSTLLAVVAVVTGAAIVR